MSTAVRHLIVKDLLLMRWWMVGTIAGGLIAAWVMTLGSLPIGAGGVLMICTLIILNIFVVMTGVVTERKEHVTLFLFTFPVSRGQYVAAKVAANAIAFGLPWLVLTPRRRSQPFVCQRFQTDSCRCGRRCSASSSSITAPCSASG